MKNLTLSNISTLLIIIGILWALMYKLLRVKLSDDFTLKATCPLNHKELNINQYMTAKEISDMYMAKGECKSSKDVCNEHSRFNDREINRLSDAISDMNKKLDKLMEIILSK